MNVRRWILRLLLTLTALFVLLVIAAIYLLLASVTEDLAVAHLIRWFLGGLVAAILAVFALMVLVLACERVLGENQEL